MSLKQTMLYAVVAAIVLWMLVDASCQKASASPNDADRIARQYNIDPVLLKAVCETESSWRPHVTGDNGQSIGLCQLNPETALRLFPKHWHGKLSYAQRVAAMRKLLFDPNANMAIAAIYLKYLIAKYRGDITMALLAYNAGENHSAVRHIEKIKSKMEAGRAQ